MSAPVASETRSPLSASREISACSAGGPSPAATRSAPSSLRSRPSGVGLVVQPRPPHVRCGRVIEQFFLDRVAVEPSHRAQAAGDGGPGPAAGFQIAGEELDVGAAGAEQMELVLLAPAGELAQVQFVGLAGQAAVAGQESG